jgi:hypothetical protein
MVATTTNPSQLQHSLAWALKAQSIRTTIARSALIGSIAGAEVSTLGNVSPAIGSFAGLCALGSTAYVIQTALNGDVISENERSRLLNEDNAERFANSVHAAELFNGVIHIELA